MKNWLSSLVAVMVLLCLSTAFVFATGEQEGEERDTLVYYRMIGPGTEYPFDPEQEELVYTALSDFVEGELGVGVEIRVPGTSSDYDERMPLLLASGEYMDLFESYSWNNDYVANMRNGYAAPLTDLIEQHAPYIEENYLEPGFLNAFKYEGSVRVIPLNTVPNIRATRIFLPNAIKEEFGWDFGDVRSWDDIEPFMQEVVESGRDLVPLNARGGLPAVTTLIGDLGIKYKVLGGSLPYVGVDFNDTAGQLYHVFEDPEVLAMLNTMHRWYEVGYLPDDALTIASQQWMNMEQGAQTVFHFHPYYGGTSTLEIQDAPYDGDAYHFVPDEEKQWFYGFQGGMMVHSQSEKQKQSIEFLELMHTDDTIPNFLGWGIEGEHYTSPDGVHAIPIDGSGYAPGGTTAFMGLLAEGTPPEIVARANAQLDLAMVSPLEGFIFDSQPVRAELANVNAVFEQYGDALWTTAVDDYESLLSEYVDEVRAAGLQAIIDEGQRQVDEFLSNR